MPRPSIPEQPPNPDAARVVLLVFSLGAAMLGGMFFLGGMGIVLLELFHEPRVVHDAQTLEAGAETCVICPTDQVEPINEGKLVYTTGQVTGDETLRDDQLGISAPGLKLTRTVQIYQWVERRASHLSGTPKRRTITHTYHHQKRWGAQPVDSAKFHPDSTTGKRPSNVGTLPLPHQTWYAKEVRLGGFALVRRQVDRLSQERLPLTKAIFAGLPAAWKNRLTLASNGTLYLPVKPGGAKDPQIGDVRITFEVMKPQTVSLMARQVGDSFEPWHLRESSNPIDELRQGSVSKEEMFNAMESHNPEPSWGPRLFGLILATIGLMLMVQPLAALRGSRPIVSGRSLLLSLLALLLAPALVVLIHGVRWYFVAPASSVLPLAIGLPACLLILGAGFLVLRGPRQVA
jgi:hypothetical protein